MLARVLGRRVRCWTSNNYDKDTRDYGQGKDHFRDYTSTHINQERIQKKMEEIKKRKAGESKPQISDLMPNIGTYKLSPEVEKFRRDTNSQRLFLFEDEELKPKGDFLVVNSFDPSMLEVNGLPYPPSLILFDRQLVVWEVESAGQIALKHFDILKVLSPKPCNGSLTQNT